MTAHPLVARWQAELAGLNSGITDNLSDRAWRDAVRVRVLKYLISRYGDISPESEMKTAAANAESEFSEPLAVITPASGRPPKSPHVIRRLLADIHANVNWAQTETDAQAN